MKTIKYIQLPEGAISTEYIDKIHLTRLLEERGAGELIPVLSTFAHGWALEEQGKYKEAQRLYKESLRHNPKNPWIKAASERVRHTLN